MASDERSEKAETGMVPGVATKFATFQAVRLWACCCISHGQFGSCLVP